jgi:hypothetical protein
MKDKLEFHVTKIMFTSEIIQFPFVLISREGHECDSLVIQVNMRLKMDLTATGCVDVDGNRLGNCRV